MLTNKNKDYIIVRYDDLDNSTQLEIDKMLRERAEDQVNTEIEDGEIEEDYADNRVEQLMEEWTNEIWTELEV